MKLRQQGTNLQVRLPVWGGVAACLTIEREERLMCRELCTPSYLLVGQVTEGENSPCENQTA